MEIETIKDLRNLVEEAVNTLHMVSRTVANNYIEIEELNIFREKILKIKNIPGISNYINPLLNGELFRDHFDNKIVSPEVFKRIHTDFGNLLDALELLKTTLSNYYPKDSDSSINIKLPPTSDLGDLSEYTKLLHNAISQVTLLDEIQGKEEIIGVENGSIWLTVELGTTGISLIGALWYAATVVQNFIHKCRMNEEHLRSIKADNKIKEDIAKLNEASIKNTIEAEAFYVQSQHFKENLPEELEKLKNSIRIFAELKSKGTDIKPSLQASNEIKHLFPVIPELAESKAIKQIENQ